MDISWSKYVRLLAGAAIITYCYIYNRKQKAVEEISESDKEGRRFESKWTDGDWKTLMIGSIFGAPVIDAIVTGLSYLFLDHTSD